jgi:hypothetical protein
MVALGAAAAAGLTATYVFDAFAGVDTPTPVLVLPGLGWGAAGTAHNTVNRTEYIYCMLTAYDSSPPTTLQCDAIDANGAEAYCATTDPHMISAVQKLQSDSFIGFAFDAASNCTEVYVRNGSIYEPTRP